MTESNHKPPGWSTLLRTLASTVLGTLENRGELLSVEWQEERLRMAELLVRGVAFLFMAMMVVMLLTATIIFLFPEGARLYAAAGFILLYLLGAVVAGFGLRSVILEQPFVETLT